MAPTVATLHLLACSMIAPNQSDLVTDASGKVVEIITSSMENQGRVVGRHGQNIKALKKIAEWLGHVVILAEYDSSVAGRGTMPEIHLPTVFQTDPKAAVDYFLALGGDLLRSARVRGDVDAVADVEGQSISVGFKIHGGNRPDAFTTAAIAKVFRAIAVRHGWENLDFVCD